MVSDKGIPRVVDAEFLGDRYPDLLLPVDERPDSGQDFRTTQRSPQRRFSL